MDLNGDYQDEHDEDAISENWDYQDEHDDAIYENRDYYDEHDETTFENRDYQDEHDEAIFGNWDYQDEHDEAIFENYYCCFPVSSILRPSLENGDKIIMPPSALDRLASLNIEYPMLFQLRNPVAEKVSHCGVLEFTADEGVLIIPNWMMENMYLQEGQLVLLRSTSLAKGTFIKLQPHTKDFLDMSNPKAMLETSLRSYSCLTTGDTIMIPYNNKKYYINVIETKPSSSISIIETDCEVDFAPPLDYKEPEKQLSSVVCDRECPQAEDEIPAKTPHNIAFSGSGQRLDGKPSTLSAEQTPSSMPKQQQQTENGTKSSNRACGKLVFGSNANTPQIKTQPKASLESTSQESSQKAKKPKFQAFTGKKYSLRS